MGLKLLQRIRTEAETFRRIVDQRGQALRALSYDELLRLVDEPVTEVVVGQRRGEVAVIVEDCGGVRLKVIVQGFLPVFAWFPRWKGVALHGFYRHKSGALDEMSDEEFYGYD